MTNYFNNIDNINIINNNIFGFWDSNILKQISREQEIQINLWAKSILFFHPNTNLWLITKEILIPKLLINIKGLNIIYINNLQDLFIDTPLINYKISTKLSKPELSDIIRLVLLYKKGGTWLDIDDIVVRKFPERKNILGTFLWENNKEHASYWGSTFNLVNGSLVSNNYKDFGFHIQNDPMVNWEQGNKFLLEWLKNIQDFQSSDWGQKIPTEIIRKDNNLIKECNITLLPQHHLLLHPAFGNNKQFGYPKRKGPMFPPYDLRIKGKVNYDDMITKDMFWEVIEQTLKLHDYCCVKNSKNIGIKQCNEGKEKRWFIGYLCNLINFQQILNKIKNINSFNLLFHYKGLIKYGNIGDDIFYPISIILLKTILETNLKKYTNKIVFDKINHSSKEINITGGGSLIHANQKSFTNFANNNNNYLLLGTGMTDINLSNINSSNINDFINNMNKYSFKNENVKINLDKLKYFQDNNQLYGGFRGLYEKYICNNNLFDFKYINDLGLLSDILLKEKDIVKLVYNIEDNIEDNINNLHIGNGRKLVLINTTYIFGIDAFKNKEITYEQYNSKIANLLAKFSIYLIKNNYSIVIMPFHILSKKETNITNYVYNSIKKCINQDEYQFLHKILNYNIISGLETLKNVHIALGIRLHCNIICNGFLIPTINIAYGVKCINYSVTNNLSKYIIPTFNDYLNIENIKQKFFDIEKDYENIQNILKKNKINTEQLINNEITKLLNNYNLNKYNKFDIKLNKTIKGNEMKYNIFFF